MIWLIWMLDLEMSMEILIRLRLVGETCMLLRVKFKELMSLVGKLACGVS